MIEEPGKATDASAGRIPPVVAKDTPVETTRGVANLKAGVEVVGHQSKSRIKHPSVERSIVEASGGQPTFRVSNQRVRSDKLEHLIDIQHGSDGSGEICVRDRRLFGSPPGNRRADDAAKIYEIRVVVLILVRLLQVSVAVGEGIR